MRTSTLLHTVLSPMSPQSNSPPLSCSSYGRLYIIPRSAPRKNSKLVDRGISALTTSDHVVSLNSLHTTTEVNLKPSLIQSKTAGLFRSLSIDAFRHQLPHEVYECSPHLRAMRFFRLASNNVPYQIALLRSS